MSEVKRVHKNLGSVRIVSLVDRFGYYIQVKPYEQKTDESWFTISQWDYLGNARACAALVYKGLAGGFIHDVHPK